MGAVPFLLGKWAIEEMSVRRAPVMLTGASTGIGFAIVENLLAAGYSVLAGVRREQDAARLGSLGGGRCRPLMLDVASPEDRLRIRAEIAGLVGEEGLGGLVHNAGLAVFQPVEGLDDDLLLQQFQVNVFGAVALTRDLLPHLRRAKGTVVHVSSLAGNIAQPYFGAYAASKWALEAFTDALRIEVAPQGVKVVSIQPGAIATPIWQKSLAQARARHGALPQELAEFYGADLEHLARGAAMLGARGLSPRRVAAVVRKALEARSPRARYRVGPDARLGPWLRVIPDGLRDALLRRVLGLGRHGGGRG